MAEDKEAFPVDKTDRKDDCYIWKEYEDGYIVRSMRANETHIPGYWFRDYIISKDDVPICQEIFLGDGAGLYIGEYDGKIVASAVRVPWGNSIYYGSMYYVAKEYRSRGFGTRLRDQVAFSHIGKNILCIDAVTGSVSEKNVKRFFYEQRCLTGRFEGVSEGDYKIDIEGKISRACDIDFKRLIDYDNTIFISHDNPQRKEFLKRLVHLHDSSSYIAIDNNNNIIGCGIQRSCIQEGHVTIGPLYGRSLDIAEALLKRLLNDVKGKRFTINLYQPNDFAMELVKRFKMDKICDFNRMHANGDAKEVRNDVFALTSVEVCGF